MKTIISGPKPDRKPPGPSRGAVITGSCLAVAAVSVIVLATQARGTELPVSELPETGIVHAASMDGCTGSMDDTYRLPELPEPDESDTAPSRTPYPLEIRKSAQLANGAWNPDGEAEDSSAVASDSGTDAVTDGRTDAADAAPAAQAAAPESAAVPASSWRPANQAAAAAGNEAQDEDAQELAAAKAELQAATSELAATRRELEAARKALADEKAANQPANPAEAAVPAQPVAPADAAADAPDESGPPDWLAQPEESTPPSWITGPGTEAGAQATPWEWPTDALERAALANPYDGGPLCQASYAEVPCPVDNASTRLYVEPGIPLSSLTQADLVHFVLRSVRPCQASWATIIGTDGIGIQFISCATTAGVVGPVDEYGRVTDIICYIVLTDEGYGIVPYA